MSDKHHVHPVRRRAERDLDPRARDGRRRRVAGRARRLCADATSAARSPPRCWRPRTRSTPTEVEIDRDLSTIIARRQPTARDLRLLIAISKTIANLERVGDEAARIARTVQRLVNSGVSSRLRLPVNDLAYESELAVAQLRKALDAFARLDVERAVEVLKDDDLIDQEFEGLMRKLITFMMEDPRTISSSIDLVFVAKAIERVGDHAKNLAEQIIYIVKGTDVRHSSVGTVETMVR